MWSSAFYSGFAPARLLRGAALAAALSAAGFSGGCSTLSFALPGLGLDNNDATPRREPPTGAVGRLTPILAGPLLPPEQALGSADWTAAQSTLVTALAATEPSSASWINPLSGTMGTVSTKPAAGPRCRGFDVTVFRKEASERLSGEACRGQGGWRVLGLRAAGVSP